MAKKPAPAPTPAEDMRIEFVALDELARWPSNPKLHDEPGLDASIAEHGFVSPPIIDEGTGRLVAGHGRADALIARKARGLAPPARIRVRESDGQWLVPVVRGVAFPTAAAAERFLLADNRLVELGGWDDAALLAILAEQQKNAGADALLGTGFSTADVERLSALAQAGTKAEPEPSTTGSLVERFMIPPFTVLNAREGWWQARKAAWLGYGIRSEVGRGDNALGFSDTILNNPRAKQAAGVTEAGLVFGRMTPQDGAERTINGTSIFDPVLCELAYRWFSPREGLVLDPFAGGSVRGIVASKLGRAYVGGELRPEQVAANREQAALICAGDRAPPVWIEGDSRRLDETAAGIEADMIFSCPPYADLEVYSDDPLDLSTMDYPAFRAAYREIIAKACELLKKDRFAAFVVGDVRDARGIYRGFIQDTISAFEAAGLGLYNEFILVTALGTLPIRAGKQFAATRKAGKAHQQVLVFVKGDPRRATEACGPVDVADPEDSFGAPLSDG